VNQYRPEITQQSTTMLYRPPFILMAIYPYGLFTPMFSSFLPADLDIRQKCEGEDKDKNQMHHLLIVLFEKTLEVLEDELKVANRRSE